MSKSAWLFVWCGGVLFVGSLAFCAYAFLFRWSAAADPHWPALAIDALVFSLFAIHHSVFARTRAKAWLARAVQPRLQRSVYVWVASLLLIFVCAAWQPIGGVVYRHTGWAGAAHAVVQLLGVWLIAGSVRTIDPLDLAGIRPIEVRPAAGGPESGERLQSTGPYGLVRHPLYFGWTLIVFGAALMTGDRLAFAVITTAYLVVAIPWEERSLREAFGSEYERYTRQVRWRMLPFIY